MHWTADGVWSAAANTGNLVHMPLFKHTTTDIPLGIGCYTVPEAARLLRMRPLDIRRWLGG